MKILIADDDPINLLLLQKLLDKWGYEVVAARDGEEAWNILRQEDAPKLSIIDWMMPGMDGLEICREVRERHVQFYSYILLLTSNVKKEDIVAGLEAGADDYLTKPLNPEELKARLRTGERILQLQDKLVHDARHDSLTQLPNRAYFFDRLTQCVKQSKRRPDYKFAVLLVDLDRFKIVNDSLGHAAGDHLIMQVAERLMVSIRREDPIWRPDAIHSPVRPSGLDILARLGGDEFTILLDDIRDIADGIRVAERIQQNLVPPFFVTGYELQVTASIGIAVSATGYSAAEEVLRHADTAMYRAKALGKSRYEMCDSAMHAIAVSRLSLENDLRRAIERNELRVHYQPIVSLPTGCVSSFEALIRWERPGFGLVAPSDFISIAEETGMILPIGMWVLREACRQLRDWQLRFPSEPAFMVAVNFSAKQFLQPDVVSEVDRILRETGLDPGSLGIELTETVTMRDPERAALILDELKTLGVRTCIDDFGTGYSSLTYLRRFALDTLKIDRSFVCEMNSSIECREIVHAVMSLGHNLGMDVVAEGVELVSQADELRSLGCRYAQGYFFSKPLDASQAEALLGCGSPYKLPLRVSNELAFKG